jgi:hypothetical protein
MRWAGPSCCAAAVSDHVAGREPSLLGVDELNHGVLVAILELPRLELARHLVDDGLGWSGSFISPTAPASAWVTGAPHTTSTKS